jgi:hypothetical protein
MSSRDALILDDVFEVIQKDPDGKKFDRGGLHRVLACNHCKSDENLITDLRYMVLIMPKHAPSHGQGDMLLCCCCCRSFPLHLP